MAELAPASGDRTYSLGYAGDTFNTAWYLARLSTATGVSYFTAFGDDALSYKMRAFMADAGVDAAHSLTISNKTVGLYLISLSEGERSFSYWRGESAARFLASDPDRLAKAMSAADVIYFSGITLAILNEAGRATLFSAVADARARGKTIAFDPNLRPKLWSSPDEMCATVMAGASVSDVALPSFEDEAQWFGDADPQATLARYTGAGTTTVVVKDGGAPVLFASPQSTGTRPVPALPSIVDTTAAGDSFNAAILAGLAENQPLSDSVDRAIALAARVVQGKGALVDIDAGAV